jgi:hypothetical protein
MFMRSDELIWVSIYKKYQNCEIPLLGGIFGEVSIYDIQDAIYGI